MLDAGLAMAIPTWLSHIFTGELKVQASMLHVVWHLGASLVLHANVVALEGVLFAAREAAFLARAYAVSTVVFTSAMVAARSLAPSLVTVWWALVLYQVLRLLQFGIKVDAISDVLDTRTHIQWFPAILSSTKSKAFEHYIGTHGRCA